MSQSKREALSNGAIARLLKKEGSGLDRVSQKAVDEARKLLTKKIAYVG